MSFLKNKQTSVALMVYNTYKCLALLLGSYKIIEAYFLKSSNKLQCFWKLVTVEPSIIIPLSILCTMISLCLCFLSDKTNYRKMIEQGITRKFSDSEIYVYHSGIIGDDLYIFSNGRITIFLCLY